MAAEKALYVRIGPAVLAAAAVEGQTLPDLGLRQQFFQLTLALSHA